MADWKEELKNAYDKSADEKVKQSDAVYQKKMAQVLGDSLSRGLGRSSYAAATQANLLNDMNEAGNQIRTDFRLEYLKALQQRELEEAQLAENRRQFDLKMALGSGGSNGGGGYGGYGGYSGGPSTPSTAPGTTSDPNARARSLLEIEALKNANKVNAAINASANAFGNAASSAFKKPTYGGVGVNTLRSR